jgi:hypothetical protein
MEENVCKICDSNIEVETVKFHKDFPHFIEACHTCRTMFLFVFPLRFEIPGKTYAGDRFILDFCTRLRSSAYSFGGKPTMKNYADYLNTHNLPNHKLKHWTINDFAYFCRRTGFDVKAENVEIEQNITMTPETEEFYKEHVENTKNNSEEQMEADEMLALQFGDAG